MLKAEAGRSKIHVRDGYLILHLYVLVTLRDLLPLIWG